MNYKDYVAKLAELKMQEESATEKLQELMQSPEIKKVQDIISQIKQESDKTKSEVFEKMKNEGIERTSTDTHTLILARKPSVKVVNPIAFSGYFRTNKIDPMAYMKEDKTMMMNFAKQKLADGEKVNGIEESFTEYLTLREKSNGKQDNKKS